jgi:squalene-associated FAD-dependent desaturase
MSSFDAIIIGGGCAGFSAATALAERRARVLLVEARPGLGGRATAFRDPETGERVDNGQHVLMGCYTDTLRFLDRIGAADRVRRQSGLTVAMIDRRGHESVLALPSLPSPLHFLAGVLAWDALSWRERISVLKIGPALRERPAEAARDVEERRTVRQWLEHHGQAERLCELLWEPLALAALNQSIDQAEASNFIRVLARVFGPDPAAAALVLPAVPLDAMYVEPSLGYLAERGGEVRVNAPARITIDAGRVRGVRVRDEMIDAPVVISTVPWFAFNGVFDTPPPQLQGTLANAAALDSLPIVTVNLWFDAAVMREPLLGLPGRTFQWVFDRRAIVGGEASHLSMVASGAEALVAQSNEALVHTALQEVREALPAARRAGLRKGLAVREKRSTFSLAPGAPPRPGMHTPIAGLLLAGDWIQTGLPATIESAVISGHNAARAAEGGEGLALVRGIEWAKAGT